MTPRLLDNWVYDQPYRVEVAAVNATLRSAGNEGFHVTLGSVTASNTEVIWYDLSSKQQIDLHCRGSASPSSGNSATGSTSAIAS